MEPDFCSSQPKTSLPVSREEMEEIFRDRWRTLLSVDDLVEAVINKLEDLGRALDRNN